LKSSPLLQSPGRRSPTRSAFQFNHVLSTPADAAGDRTLFVSQLTVTFQIAPSLLKPKLPRTRLRWALWEKKNLNLHRGLIEFTALHVDSIHDLAREAREGVHDEFRPGWFRGFGFGTIIHFHKVPSDFAEICQHVDTRNKRHGVWQWTVACLDEEKVAVAIHTWLNGYLRPVYDSVLQQLDESGYKCHPADAEVDVLVTRLQQIAKTCHAIRRVSGVVS